VVSRRLPLVLAPLAAILTAAPAALAGAGGGSAFSRTTAASGAD
jgi:hypothetical protein